MSDQFTVVIEPDQDGFHAYVPALPGCHTFGLTIDETRSNILEPMTLHIECMQEEGESISVEREPFFVTHLSVSTKSESFQTMLASEAVLRRDWDLPEEDEAWADL